MLPYVLGRTRTTLTRGTSLPALGSCLERDGESLKYGSCWGQMIAIICLERGMPRRRMSSTCTDYVPAICTHRPSLLPIGIRIETIGLFGLRASGGKLADVRMLEEAKVVTRLL